MRVWKVPPRWPGDGTGAAAASSGGGGGGGGGRPAGGLHFCATLLTNSSICSFSCVILRPWGSVGGAMSTKAYNAEGVEGGDPGGHGERRKRRRGVGQGSDARGAPGVAGRQRSGAPTGGRLYCVIGSDNGFVQAWELSLEGEKGVGGQPLWSQKVGCDNRRCVCVFCTHIASCHGLLFVSLQVRSGRNMCAAFAKVPGKRRSRCLIRAKYQRFSQSQALAVSTRNQPAACDARKFTRPDPSARTTVTTDAWRGRHNHGCVGGAAINRRRSRPGQWCESRRQIRRETKNAGSSPKGTGRACSGDGNRGGVPAGDFRHE